MPWSAPTNFQYTNKGMIFFTCLCSIYQPVLLFSVLLICAIYPQKRCQLPKNKERAIIPRHVHKKKAVITLAVNSDYFHHNIWTSKNDQTELVHKVSVNDIRKFQWGERCIQSCMVSREKERLNSKKAYCCNHRDDTAPTIIMPTYVRQTSKGNPFHFPGSFLSCSIKTLHALTYKTVQDYDNIRQW